MGDILYEECRGRFRVLKGKQRVCPRYKGRKERAMELVVKRQRHLRKQWREAGEEEKEGLKPLWEEVKKNLDSLRRAERIRKHKNSYKYARQVLEKRSGKLEITKVEFESYFRD